MREGGGGEPPGSVYSWTPWITASREQPIPRGRVAPTEDVVITAAVADAARARLDYTGSTGPDCFADLTANVWYANDCMSLAGDVAFAGTSPVVIAGDTAVSVALPAIAGRPQPFLLERSLLMRLL